MTDHSHIARHRAGRQAASKPRRVIAGLALPTAATLALMFGATGAAVATSPKSLSLASLTSPQRPTAEVIAARAGHLTAIEQAQAVAMASRRLATQTNLDATRANAVARSVEREKVEAEAEVAKAAALAHSWRLPITNPRKTSGFGYRWGRLHAGEDFGVSVGTPLAAMSTGTVVFAGQESGFGNLVQVRYWDGTISYYGHMSKIKVDVGESVEPGQIVGLSGNTGHSTGPHLHLEIHPEGGKAIDPLPWLADHHISP